MLCAIRITGGAVFLTASRIFFAIAMAPILNIPVSMNGTDTHKSCPADGDLDMTPNFRIVKM